MKSRDTYPGARCACLPCRWGAGPALLLLAAPLWLADHWFTVIGVVGVVGRADHLLLTCLYAGVTLDDVISKVELGLFVLAQMGLVQSFRSLNHRLAQQTKQSAAGGTDWTKVVTSEGGRAAGRRNLT